jgi:hypothetical protein
VIENLVELTGIEAGFKAFDECSDTNFGAIGTPGVGRMWRYNWFSLSPETSESLSFQEMQTDWWSARKSGLAKRNRLLA